MKTFFKFIILVIILLLVLLITIHDRISLRDSNKTSEEVRQETVSFIIDKLKTEKDNIVYKASNILSSGPLN